MSYSRRPKAGGRRLTNTSIAAFGARDVESIEVVSNEIDTTVVDQSDGTGTADLEMSIADVVDEDCDSDASTSTNLHKQRSSGYSEKRLDAVAPFIEMNPNNLASTLEWRRRVLHAQEATQATSSRQRHTAEERRRAKLVFKIERIQRHYQELERILESEIVKHEKRYKLATKQLEDEEKDEEDCSGAEWWDVQSDYQPTECGNDGSG